jgi:hypothetical protein
MPRQRHRKKKFAQIAHTLRDGSTDFDEGKAHGAEQFGRKINGGKMRTRQKNLRQKNEEIQPWQDGMLLNHRGSETRRKKRNL